MDLDQQLQVLIDHAPHDGKTPGIIAAIGPALKILAQQLHHLQYYVLQTLAENWVLTTLSNRTQPDLEKRVIYAFPTREDALASAEASVSPHLVAIPVPVTHILFQMIAMEPLDSLVFFEQPGSWEMGTEVGRDEVQRLVQVYLQQYRPPRHPRSSGKIPPNWA